MLTEIRIMNSEVWINRLPEQPTEAGTFHLVLSIHGNGRRAVLEKRITDENDLHKLVLDIKLKDEPELIENPQFLTYAEHLVRFDQYKLVDIYYGDQKMLKVRHNKVLQ